MASLLSSQQSNRDLNGRPCGGGNLYTIHIGERFEGLIRKGVLICLIVLISIFLIQVEGDQVKPSSMYINELIKRKEVRNLIIQRDVELSNYTSQIDYLRKLTTNQRKAISLSKPKETKSDKAYSNYERKNLETLQSITLASHDTHFIQNATNLVLKSSFQRFSNTLLGLNTCMNSSLIPQTLSNNMMNTSYPSLKAIPSVFYRPSQDTYRERTTMCTGDYFGLYLDVSTSVLYSWGLNTLGRGGSSVQSPVNLYLVKDEYIKQLACGSSHALVLTNKALYAWGSNNYGQLGFGDNANYFDTPKQVEYHKGVISYINAGPYNSLYIDYNGYAQIWGRGTENQIGVKPATNKRVPTLLSTTLKFSKICMGIQHAIGVSQNGTFYYWGMRISPDGVDRYTIPSNATVPVAFPSSFYPSTPGVSILDFQCGDYSTILLLSDGTVSAFGYNANGALGTGTRLSTTTPVAIKRNVIGNYRKIIKIAHRNEQAIALSHDRKLFVWGANTACACATGKTCETQLEPDFAKVPKVDNFHDLSILREGSFVMYSMKSTIGYLLGGNQQVSSFNGVPQGTYNYMRTAIVFDVKYIPPMERKYPIYENATHRSIVTETSFFTITPESLDLISVKKSALDKPISTKAQASYFDAFSFHSTHDFQIDGETFYFGGFVNNTLSDRIISKLSLATTITYNQTLPYPVASGMVTLVDEFLYIFGGLTLDRGEITPTYKVMRANVSNLLIWEEVTKEYYLPLPVYNGVIYLMDSTLYLLGGRAAPNNQPISEIYTASIFDMIWQNTTSLLPYPMSETNLVMDKDGIYLIGGYLPKYKPSSTIIKANKNLPLQWFDTLQKVSNTYLGITYPYVDNSTTLYIYSLDYSSNYLKTGQNISLTTYKITFTNQIFNTTTLVYYSKSVVDGAFIDGDYGLKSCIEYLVKYPAQGSGYYWIWPNEEELNFVVYCEQSVADGGWALVSSRTNPIDPQYVDRVAPDYSGSSLADDKWALLQSIGSAIMYKGISTGPKEFATASLEVLQRKGNCKAWSSSLKDPSLFWREDNGCNGSGYDYCILGVGTGRSAELYTDCYYSPFGGYSGSSTSANIYIR